MIGYIGYKLKQYTLIKLIIFAALMLTGLIIGIRFFGSYTQNALEATVFMLTDKLFVSTVFVLIAVAFANNLFISERCEVQLMIRLKTARRWYIYNLITVIIVLAAFLFIYFTASVAVGALSGMNVINLWTDGIAEVNIATGTCIDSFGYPLDAVMYAGLNPFGALLTAYILLLFRCIFILLAANLFSAIFKKRIIGLIGAVLINYADMFFFSNINTSFPLFMYAHSSVSAVNSSRASFTVSVIYWCVLIIAEIILCYQFQTDTSEVMMLSLSQENR